MVKALSKLGGEGSDLSTIKTIYSNPIANMKLKEPDKGVHSDHTRIQHSSRKFEQLDKRRKQKAYK
jgi:hypothetical protein